VPLQVLFELLTETYVFCPFMFSVKRSVSCESLKFHLAYSPDSTV
jgi:hypothetical protein